jgi:thymidine phosphorylase
LRGGRGIARARELLESGAAMAKMQRLMAAQGPAPLAAELGTRRRDVTSSRDGVVATIDCLRLSRIARLAGAPLDKGAGVDLFKKVGDPVVQGEPLYRIHAALETDFQFACKFAAETDGYGIASAA